jgi:hypothetical protein
MITVLDRRFNVLCPADTQCSLVINVNAMISVKIIADSAVALGRIIVMDIFHDSCNPFIFSDPFARVTSEPFVVSRSCYMKDGAA